MSYNNADSSANILGLGNIVNRDTINKNINLKNVEMDLLSDISSQTNHHSNHEYKKEIYNKNIKDIANEIGVDIDNISTFLDDEQNDNNVSNDNQNINNRQPSIVSNNISCAKSNDREKERDNDSHISQKSDNVRNDFPSLQQRFFDRAENDKNDYDKHSANFDKRNNISQNHEKNTAKNEQFRHDVFSNVLQNIKPNADYTHDIYTEELKNKKSMLLEQIELLKLLLQEENENISNIPDLDENDTIDRLNHIYMILKIKKDRLQFDTLGNEFIMFIVHLLEGFFDGERVFLGRYKPDLTGWHNSVGVKLRRMRYETSTVVSDIVQTYNISYGTRLAIELIPSMFLYSKVRTACANKKKYAKNNMADNLSSIDI